MINNVQLIVHFLAIATLLAYSIAYTIGGRDKAPIFRPRIWKRFIASLLFCTGVIGISLLSKKFLWPMLLSYGTYIGAHYLLKYGGETLWAKVRGRISAGLVISLASLPFAVCAKSYVFLGTQVCLAILAHIVLGIANPFSKMGEKGAWLEEGLIAFLTCLFVPYMVI